MKRTFKVRANSLEAAKKKAKKIKKIGRKPATLQTFKGNMINGSKSKKTKLKTYSFPIKYKK